MQNTHIRAKMIKLFINHLHSFYGKNIPESNDIIFFFNGLKMRLYNGSVYKKEKGKFKQMNSPHGIIVPVLPSGAFRIKFEDQDLFYYESLCYKKTLTGFKIIKEPVKRYNAIHNKSTIINFPSAKDLLKSAAGINSYPSYIKSNLIF